jgi:hypothetical protein
MNVKIEKSLKSHMWPNLQNAPHQTTWGQRIFFPYEIVRSMFNQRWENFFNLLSR